MSEQQEVIYAEVTEGDYNDVYSRKYVKGSWDQIEAFVKDYFSKEGLERAEEINSDGYGLEVYQNTAFDNNGNEIPLVDLPDEEKDMIEPLIEYYVEASPFDTEQDQNLIKEIESDSRFINLMEDD